MTMKMKDFLTNYYSRLVMNEMPYEQFVQFCGYIKDNKATDNQKIWADELLKKDPATGQFLTRPNTNIYIPKDLPDPTDPTDGMDDKEWIKLFLVFQRTLQSMDSSRSSFKYNDDAKQFVDEHFGTNPVTGRPNLFQYSKISPSAESKIYVAPATPNGPTVPGTLYAFLEKHRRIVESRLAAYYYTPLSDSFSYDDLLEGLKNGEYRKASFRQKLEKTISFISGNNVDLVSAGIPANDFPDLSDSDTWFDDENISPIRLSQFKLKYKELLNTLYKNSKVSDVFVQHDYNNTIAKPLEKAKAIKEYDNPSSEDYVQPKREDTLTMSERLAQWWSDTYSDCFEKYEKLMGDRLFFSPQAKAIAKHLTKKFDKTGGLDAVLKNIGDAKEKLNKARDFKSVKHLDWFNKTLTELKNDPKLSHVWAGALKDGTHMQALVKEIMIKAIKENKKEEAKTALELISVMHYDYTTSKIMDMLKKENLTIFSDSGLSWNKVEGVKFVTNALDKSIKWALMGIGYGITIAGNAYKLSGRKIKRYTDKSGNFKAVHDEYLDNQETQRQDLQNQLQDERTQKGTIQTQVDGIRAGRTYSAAEADIRNQLNISNASIRRRQNGINRATNNLVSQLYDPSGNPLLPDADMYLINDFFSNLANTPPPAVPRLSVPNITTATGAVLDVKHKLKLIRDRQVRLNVLIDNNNAEQNKLDQLIEGTDLLIQLDEQITRHEQELANWDSNHTDDLEELVLYWNRLETGRNTKTGPMYNWFRNLSAKEAQKRLNRQKNTIISNYNASHSIAA